MFLMKQTILALFVFSALAFAQSNPLPITDSLPSNFMVTGAGFQGTGSPQLSGFFDACIAVPTATHTFGCAATDFSTGGVSSARADVDQVLYQYKHWFFGGKAGAGAATGTTGGIGASFEGGGFAVCESAFLEKLLPGTSKKYYLVASASWLKNNVDQAVSGTPGALKSFASQTTFRFGVGW